MIAGVKCADDEPRPPGMKPSRRKGNWSALVPTLGAGLCIYATLTYLWDTADRARLGMLILFSVTFGPGLGQLPPVKPLLRGNEPGRT
jgi:hypothetical protein